MLRHATGLCYGHTVAAAMLRCLLRHGAAADIFCSRHVTLRRCLMLRHIIYAA